MISTGYNPHFFQLEFHMAAKRFNVLVAHRRWGKTVAAVNTLVDAALRNERTAPAPRYFYVAPIYKQAKAVAWDYLKYFTAQIPGVKVNESETWIELPHNKARIRIYGADNPDGMRGLYADGAVLDEVAQMKSEVWGEVIRPALSDYKGWVLFIGTPKGVNMFHELYYKAIDQADWYAGFFPVSKTLDRLPWLDEKELDLARQTMSDAQYRQEFECDFNASSEDTLIPLDMVGAARGKHLDLSEYSSAPKVLGVDVARFGSDRSVIIKRQGLACFQPIIFRDINNMELADRVVMLINDWNPDAVFIDGGRGEGVIDRVRQLGYTCTEVNFGGAATDPTRYVNKRVQMWDDIREWLKAGGALPDHLELISDLVVPTYSFNKTNGKMVLESKADIKDRVGYSPDVGDALALTFASPVAKPEKLSRQNQGTGISASASYDPFACIA